MAYLHLGENLSIDTRNPLHRAIISQLPHADALPYISSTRLAKAIESLVGSDRMGGYGAGWWMITFPGSSGCVTSISSAESSLDGNAH